MASNAEFSHNIDHKIADACLQSLKYLRRFNIKYIEHKVKPYVLQQGGSSESRLPGIVGRYQSLNVIFETTSGIISTLSSWHFVKIASAKLYLDQRLVLEELHFFTILYPLLIWGHRDKCGELWTPKCSFARPDLLIFRDARVQEFAVRLNTVYDEESMEAVLTTLARFHAASLALEVRSGEKLGKYVGEEKVFTDEGKAGRANRLAFKTLRQLASERFNIEDADLIVPKIMKRVSELVKTVDAGCNVICHSNLYRTKIMFRSTDCPMRCVLVNFKKIRYASPACDIAMLLFLHNTSAEKRDRMSKALLRHYHRVLHETLLRAGLDNESTMIPTLESIKKEYEERKLLGMAYAALSWPPMVYKQVVGGGDPAKLEDWYFYDRITWYTKAMDEDENYERKMRQRVTEFLNEGRGFLSTI